MIITVCVFSSSRIWGSEPPSRAADMLRWLASLSYNTIADQAGEYLTNTELFGKSDSEGPTPVLNPKDAVFAVRDQYCI